MSLDAYADKFSRLNVGRVGNHERPHKPVMLLAVLDLFEQGAIKKNMIAYSPELLELFDEYFEAVRGEGDQPTRRAVLDALGRIGDPQSVPAVIEALADSELTREATGAAEVTGRTAAPGVGYVRIAAIGPKTAE